MNEMLAVPAVAGATTVGMLMVHRLRRTRRTRRVRAHDLDVTSPAPPHLHVSTSTPPACPTPDLHLDSPTGGFGTSMLTSDGRITIHDPDDEQEIHWRPERDAVHTGPLPPPAPLPEFDTDALLGLRAPQSGATPYA